MNPNAGDAAVTAEAAEDAAARWFWKKDSGHWTADDQVEFDAWMNRATAHRIAYLRLSAGWEGAARMQALGAGVPRGQVPPPGHWGNDRYLGGRSAVSQTSPAASTETSNEQSAGTFDLTRKRRPHRWALAAAVVLALSVAFYVQTEYAARGSQYSTPVGGLDTVSLTDGSRVTLNTDTRIRIDFDATERRVELSRGEAFFTVARDATRPFVVHVDDKRVTAVGTQFSVRRGDDDGDIQVVVTEGRVKLEQGSAMTELRELIGVPARPATTLGAGAVAHIAKSAVLVQERAPPDAEQILSWRTGYLVFEATPLAEAVAEFNRYNTRQIVIDDPSLAALRIGGNFRSNNTDAFLWLLQAEFGVEIEQEAGRAHLKMR